MKIITCSVLTAMSIVSGGYASTDVVFRANFDDLEGWRNDSSQHSPQSYGLSNGMLRISTRAQTRDRVKVRTDKRFGAGKYTWRVYVPTMGKGDQASIGAFLYKDDRHEVDFEIGYGSAKLRKELAAKETDLVCYSTSQGHPFSSSQVLIKREAWYVLTIDITYGKDGNYLIRWFVDGKEIKQLQTNFGDQITFTAHCSVENLTFIGDHSPTQENYALFDYVEIRPLISKKTDSQQAESTVPVKAAPNAASDGPSS